MRRSVWNFTVSAESRPGERFSFIVEGIQEPAAQRRALALAAKDGLGGARVIGCCLMNWQDKIKASEMKILSESRELRPTNGRRVVIVEASCETCGIIASARGRTELNCNEALELQDWTQQLTTKGYIWRCGLHRDRITF